jgi:hypothetical protein
LRGFLFLVIAAIFASVPLLPTYVVSVPGVLDLWLLQDKSVTALCLFLLQFAPTYFVDVAIYEDIHGYVSEERKKLSRTTIV